jgi:rhodanese-related sulfurtransferase
MARTGKLFLITLLLLGLLLSTTAVVTGCGDEETTTATTTKTSATTSIGAGAEATALINARVAKTMASNATGDFNNDTVNAANLAKKLADPAEKAKLYLLDIRAKADFDKGHIEGATQVDFAKWAEADNLAKYPKDKKIVVICYTGNTAAQTMMGLRAIGYDAAVLRAGMNAWAQTSLTPTVVSDLANTSMPVVTTPSPATAAAAPPAATPEKPSDADAKILADRAASVMADMPMDGDYANFTITPAKLAEKLAGADKANLMLIDIRSQADYDKGHIDGAINIPFRATMLPENVKLLSKDKKIIVVCYTGNTAAMTNTLLRMMDFDAVVLKYGMMGWNGGGKETYLQEIQAAANPVVTS